MRNTAKIMAVFFVVLLISTLRLDASKLIVNWEKAFGGTGDDYGQSIQETSEGGFIVAGIKGRGDVYLIKTDSLGNEIWSKTLGGADTEYGYSIRQTRDGGFIVVGFTESFGAGARDVYLVKTDASGDELWSRTFGGSNTDVGYCVQETSDSGFIVAGSTDSFGAGYYDVYLIKTDSLGNELWSRTFGGISEDAAYYVQETSDGGFIITGYMNWKQELFLIKTDSAGNELWSRAFDGSQWESTWNIGHSVQETSDRGFIVAGQTRPENIGEHSHYNFYLIKTDEAGNELWSRTFGGTATDRAFSVQETSNGGFLAAGYTRSFGAGNFDTYMVKTNHFGNEIWSDTLGHGGDEIGRDIVQTSDGGFVVTGYTDSLVPGRRDDVYLVKFFEPLIETPLISPQPAEIKFAVVTGDPNPEPQTLSIYNIGIGTLNWQIIEDCPWLHATPTSGSSIGEIHEVTLTVDAAGLPLGYYLCDLIISDDAASNSPVTIEVTLSVHAQGQLRVPSEFPTIQDAIDAAKDGDTVIVAQGTYTGDGNRDIDFLGKAIIVSSENGPENCIIDCNGVPDRSHSGFLFHSGEDVNSILDGFTITGAYSLHHGGGIYCSYSSPTITNCIITGNTAGDNGGGISCESSSPTITNCTIVGNSANGGAGITCGGNTTISNCTISGNSAYNGGGIFSRSGSPVITNCTISGNWAHYDDGGGIYCAGGRGGGGSLTITNCTISGNTAEDEGGGVYCSNSSLTITNCTISGNSAGKDGGGIYCGRYGREGATFTITDCTISGNSAEQGGGIHCVGNSSATITNCILWANQPPDGQEISLKDSPHLGATIAWVSYTDVQGGQDAVYVGPDCELIWGLGNIDVDPCFADSNNGDYHLLEDSPCIDAGDPNFFAGPEERDIDGEPRVWDGRVDMGADEFVPMIEVPMKFTPQALNPKSKGNWVKAHFVLPEGFIVEDVDVNRPAWIEPLGIESDYLDVFINEDGLVEIEAGFDRAAFCAAGPVDGTVTVIGAFGSGQYFYGTDTIKIITNNLKYLGVLASHWLEQDCGKPAWCDGIDVDQDSVVNFVDFAMFDGCCIEISNK